MQIGNTSVKPKPYRLAQEDAIMIWLRYWHGEFQHNIAASYGVNPGRVNEVLKERLHRGSKTVAANRLNSAV